MKAGTSPFRDSGAAQCWRNRPDAGCSPERPDRDGFREKHHKARRADALVPANVLVDQIEPQLVSKLLLVGKNDYPILIDVAQVQE
jgi:hypothetical protein